MSGEKSSKPSTKVADELAKISYERYNSVEARFGELEHGLIAQVGDKERHKNQVTVAGDQVRSADIKSQRSFDLSLRRQGVQLTAEQRKVLQRKRGLATAVTHASAQNKTRGSVRDQDLQLAGDLVTSGQSILGNSQANLSAAANSEARRNQFNSSLGGGMGQMAGMVIGGAIGSFAGPAGAMAGASIGGSVGGAI